MSSIDIFGDFLNADAKKALFYAVFCKRKELNLSSTLVEATPGIEPGMRVLQTSRRPPTNPVKSRVC